MRKLKINCIYQHFKGDKYLVKDIVKHSETGEDLVLYYALYGDCKGYVRPLEMFLSKVDKIKYPHCQQEYRFEPITIKSVKE